jgi:hypothetical protein
VATEFEMSFTGSSKNLLNALAVLADHDVNMDTVATAHVDDRFVIKFLSGSEEKVRGTFMKSDIQFKDRQVLIIEMFNKPGQWLKVARSLVDAGIEMKASYLLGQDNDRVRYVFAVDNYQKAKKVSSKISGVAAY